MTREQSDAGTYRIAFVCSNCGDNLDVAMDGSYVEYGERHECWGDPVHVAARMDEEGIVISDDRVALQVNDGAE